MTWSGSSLSVCGLLVAVLVLAGTTEAEAQAPSSCDTSYAQAQKAYYAADFETAAALLRPCAQTPTLTDSTRARLYRLLSFVHLGQKDRPAARRAVESLLDLRPDYTPNPSRDRPDFVEIVRVAKKERAARAEADEDSRQWLPWAIGAAAASAVGTAAVLFLGNGGSGEGGEPLPRPEPPPE